MSGIGTTLACPVCGAAIAPGDRFCEACGADLPRLGQLAPEAARCPGCGAGVGEIADGYCGVCGLKQPALGDHVELAAGPGLAAVSDRGHRHARNEDAVAIAVPRPGEVVAVVNDGVSATVCPDEAAHAAATAAVAALSAAPGGPSDARLAEAFAAAREAVDAVTCPPRPPLGPPSCTFLAAVVQTAEVQIASMGDCRAAWLPTDGEPEWLTEDDSWAATEVAAGRLSPTEAFGDPRAHTITRWLGADADPSWFPAARSFTAPGPGRLVLCSDGLWNHAQQAADLAAAAGQGDAATVATRLAQFANDAGGEDNVTVVIVELPLKGQP